MSTEKLKIDCEMSRRIVTSFIDFLNTVEPAPGVDMEAIDATKDCLLNVFKLDASSLGNKENRALLWMFQSREPLTGKRKFRTFLRNLGVIADFDDDDDDDDDDASDSEPPDLLLGDDEWTSKLSTLGISKDELIAQYFAALEKMTYFYTTVGGIDNPIKVARATWLFQKAFMEMEKSGGQDHTFSLNELAESLKTRGNKVMQSKRYYMATKLYTGAVSLCDNNAIYYCNRAAALTSIGEYNEAIRDCEQAIQIDPSYTKAYSRLGSAYLALGSYKDSIEKGFNKALQLDPSNEAIKEYIRTTELKLNETFSQMTSESDPPVEPILPRITINTDGLPPETVTAYILAMFHIVGVQGINTMFDR